LKKKEAGKKKESKWDKKDKGYTMFDAECSDEELVNAEKYVKYFDVALHVFANN
jgi:hypothetical protein